MFGRAAGLLGGLLLGCVNRGMGPPDPDGGDTGSDRPSAIDTKTDARIDTTSDTTSDTIVDRGGSGGGVGTGGRGAGGGSGAGGAIGTGGRGAGGNGGGGNGNGGNGAGGAIGTGGRGAGGSGVVDAGRPDLPRGCSTRFNFEGGNLHGAFINTGYQTAFSNLSNGTDAACGTGALRMSVTVTPTADKGEVILPLGATEDVSGKTFSIAVKTTPATPANPYVIVFLVPSYTIATAFSPIPAAWTTSTVVLPSGGDAGTRGTTAIAIQVLGNGDNYSGVFSIDEVDLR